MKDRIMLLFTDKLMFLWLALASAGVITFLFHRTIGIILCAPAVILFTIAFVMLAIANRKQIQNED